MYHHQSFFLSSLLCLLLQQVGRTSAQESKETLVIGDETVTVNPTDIVINSKTIAPGSEVTIQSRPVSVDSAYDVFVSGSIIVSGPDHPASTSSHLSPSSSGTAHSSNSVSGSASDSAGSTRSSGSSGTASVHTSPSGSGSTQSQSLPSSSGSVHSSNIRSATGSSASSNPSSLSSNSLSGSAHGTGASSSVRTPSGTGTSNSVPAPSDTKTSSSVHPPSGTGAPSSSHSLGSSSVSGSAHGTGSSSSVHPPSGTGVSSSGRSSSSESAPFPSGSGSSSARLPSSPGVSPSSSRSSQTSSRPSGTAPVSNSHSGSSSNASPGSSVTPTSASATSASSGGNGATTTSEPSVSGTGLVLPTTKIATTGAAESSQAVILGVLAGNWASKGKSWGHSITIPAIKTQALNENNQFSINAVAAFTNLGGTLPPKANACGGGGLKFKRSLLSGIKNLVGDAVGLAECAVNIASDLSGKIDVPPGTTPDFDAIDGDFDALEELSEEEEDDDDNSSSSEGVSSTESSQTSSSASSKTSSSASSKTSSSGSLSSSGSSSSRSSSSASSASFSLPTVLTDGLPDTFTASLDAGQISSINSVVSASILKFDVSGTSGISGASSLSGTAPRTLSSKSSATSGASSGSSSAVSSPSVTSKPSTTGSASKTTLSSSYTGPKPDCMLDGASWMSPTSYCDCGPTAVYPTISIAATITGDEARSSAMCAYTSLNPSQIITPVSTTSAPTNIPGQGGVPGCAAVVWGPAHLDCPYASGINYCNCGGTFATPLPTTGSFINCDYTTQPTANNCPVNTAYSKSLMSASSASAVVDASSMSVISASAASVSSASAATVFDPTHTTTSCGATFGQGGGFTPAPRADVDEITQGIAHFCTPPDGTLTVKAGDPAWQNFALPNTDVIYQVALAWDPNPACSSHPAPSIVPSVPTGPDYWCNTYLLDLLNGCDTGAGEDKRGGQIFTGCAIYEWTPFIPGSGFNEPVYPWHGSKRDLPDSSRMERRGDERKNTRITRGRISRNLNAYG